MFKIFTIIFLIYYTIRLFKPSLFIGTLNSFQKVVREQELIKDKAEKNEHLTNNIGSLMSFLLLSLFSLVITIAEAIYIFSATQYGNKLITIGFVLWWIFLWLIGILKNKIKKANGTLFNDIKKVSLWRIFVSLIDVTYFGYMYFTLFLK